MTGVIGYDARTGLYWYSVTYMKVEVAAGKNQTREDIEEVKKKLSSIDWYKDYDFEF